MDRDRRPTATCTYTSTILACPRKQWDYVVHQGGVARLQTMLGLVKVALFHQMTCSPSRSRTIRGQWVRIRTRINHLSSCDADICCFFSGTTQRRARSVILQSRKRIGTLKIKLVLFQRKLLASERSTRVQVKAKKTMKICLRVTETVLQADRQGHAMLSRA